MTTQTTSFGAVGVSTALLIRRGKEFTYKLTGGATATINLERGQSAGAKWEVLETFTANTGPTTLKNESNVDMLYRFNATAYTSGTQVATIEQAPNVITLPGTSPVNTARAYEFGNSVARKTIIQCLDLLITITDEVDTAQYGGVKVYDFPEGVLLLKGMRVSGILTAGVTGTIINNWDGDVAVGSATATTGTTLVGTEADYMPSVAVSAGASDKLGVVSAYSVATALTETPVRVTDGSSTAKDMFLNFVIDDDATHVAGTALFDGTIEFNWEMLGDL